MTTPTSYTPEEQAAHRAAWAEALRSGRFRQGQGRLRDETREGEQFCCLGVACELAAGAGVTRWTGVGYDTGDGVGMNTVLPYSVREWLGLANPGGHLVDPVENVDEDGYSARLATLADLNDEAGKTFAEIADLIEAGGVRVTADVTQ